jgi:hypothetical protein
VVLEDGLIMDETTDQATVADGEARLLTSRRAFLIASAAFLGAACGSGGAASTASSGSSNAAPPSSSSPPLAPLPTLMSTGAPSIFVRSGSAGTAIPFSGGFAFRQGDIPAGSYALGSGSGLAGLQVTPRNHWRDGSLKFAVVSGRIDLAQNVEREIRFTATASAPSGTALTTADLKAASSPVATIAYGSYGSVSWSGADWDAPLLSIDSGPQMSSWVYRKPFAGDKHLVGWLEVRLFAGGAVEILPWLENGYLLVASPGQYADTATFSLGGTQRFSQALTLLNHQRAVLASGTTLSHWLGTDPGVVLRHDTAYLQGTKLTPAYRATIGSSDAIWSRIAASYTPLAQLNYPNSMGDTGYDASIGPLPEWDVAYLVSGGDVRAWRAIQMNAYAAGRYGYHFRDETTNRAPRLSQHATLVLDSSSHLKDVGTSSTGSITPAAGGGLPPLFASSHMPAIAYMAYLVTGRWYFIDELQLLSSALMLKQNDSTRNRAQGVIVTSSGTNQTRGASWSLRTLAHTAALTPESDAVMRAEYLGNVQYNIDWYYGRYAAVGNDPLGLVEPYGSYNNVPGIYTAAWWMDDFFTFAMAFTKDLQPHAASYDAKLDAVLVYKFKCVVGRLGPDQPGSYSYRRAAQYVGVIAPETAPDFSGGTGPWYADWGAAYAAMALTANGTGTNLLDSYIDQAAFATSYWANLQPAIAYAVDDGASGASAAYNRMVGASNWASNAAYFNATPVWSVRPRSTP